METPLTKNIVAGREPPGLQAYEQAGGYQAARKALREMTPAQVCDVVAKSTLRGRGGAGFPTGRKWSFMPPAATDERRPRYLVVNADEMEPGTFKDRVLLEGDPHELIEGCICAAWAVEADVCYIFLRREYVLAARRLAAAIGEAYAAGYLGKSIFGTGRSLEMRLHTSAGRYMCGEETGLINALEGRRATPRTKPPHPPVSGLWGRPTTVNNVETICCVPHIINNGAEWFRKLARGEDGGTKLYGVSGKVKRPGCWELPFGTTARELLFEHAGGMRYGVNFRALQPGGASTAFLTEEHLDTQMDFSGVSKVSTGLGTGTMIVLDDKTCPVGFVLCLARFFAQESCGWCTPCREGLPWVRELLRAIEEGRGRPEDIDMLDMHADRIRMGHTFCALAPGAMESLRSALKYFRADFVEHVNEKRCPYGT
ncbi:MAG: NADH-quinone oxidoreductase subunit NuoF [Phycisphaerae bacterium]